LGEMGADVIKVERPGAGDETRGWGPPFDSAGASAYFLSVNRNKLSIGADLAADADLGLVVSLASEADVVVENFLPGALERLGWGVGAARAARPELVWCTITGFGSGSRRPGYDFVVQAESGWMSITGSPDGEPMKHGVALADVIAGKDACVAVLAALVARGRTGVGRCAACPRCSRSYLRRRGPDCPRAYQDRFGSRPRSSASTPRWSAPKAGTRSPRCAKIRRDLPRHCYARRQSSSCTSWRPERQ
jgi:hypothetical protein